MTLEEAIQHCKEKANGSCACADDHRQLAEWLTELLERRKTEPRWIPCSERLPKEYGNYLITTHNGDVDVGTIDPKKKGVWSACDADGFYWIREVVAWMPLPKPPKEDNHDHT